MYRADIAKEAGKYSADWFLVEDYEYWLRIRNISKIGHIDELLYKYRHHQRSLSETRMIQVREKLYDLRLNMIQKMNDKIPDRIKTELRLNNAYICRRRQYGNTGSNCIDNSILFITGI